MIFPIYIVLSLISVILILLDIIPRPSDVYAYTSQNFNNLVFATSLLAGIFAGDAISRDFSREGFFTLTQPISRSEIFTARLLASFSICTLIILADFYILGLLFGYYLYGTFIPNLYITIIFGIIFIASVTSLALLFSSLLKSPVVSAIVTTLILWFAMPTIAGLLQFVNVEPWFLLNYAGSVIQALSMQSYPEHYRSITVPAGEQQITIHMYTPTPFEAALIIVAYAIFCSLLGILAYRRRELKEF